MSKNTAPSLASFPVFFRAHSDLKSELKWTLMTYPTLFFYKER